MYIYIVLVNNLQGLSEGAAKVVQTFGEDSFKVEAGE
jgi:hypothetical protein